MWQADAYLRAGAAAPAGESVVVTAHVKSGDLGNVRMEPRRPGVAVETPGVRIPRSREVSWRIRPRDRSAAVEG
jgi:hypothetical protein